MWKAHGMGMWGQCRYEIGYQWPQRVICDVMNRSLRVVDLIRFICIMLIGGSRILSRLWRNLEANIVAVVLVRATNIMQFFGNVLFSYNYNLDRIFY